jgi:DNA-directed RNA polymerase subunit K
MNNIGGMHLHYNRFERARIVGARALQLTLGAPVLIKNPQGTIDPVKLAMMEYEQNMIPITIRRTDDAWS